MFIEGLSVDVPTSFVTAPGWQPMIAAAAAAAAAVPAAAAAAAVPAPDATTSC